MTLFSWPRQAAFSRVVPKSKIYEHAAVSGAFKECFVQQVEQINWAYKLAPETVNLPATPTVAEIQVFQLTLRSGNLDQGVLKAIDRAIPFPLIFELVQEERIKLVAAYKRRAQNPKSDADSTRWVLSSYFETDWQPSGVQRQPLPVALDMAGLYEQLLTALVQKTLVSVTNEVENTRLKISETVNRHSGYLTLEQRIELADAITRQQKEIERIQSRLKREKQFNKRVAINAELRATKQELERLAGGQRPLINE